MKASPKLSRVLSLATVLLSVRHYYPALFNKKKNTKMLTACCLLATYRLHREVFMTGDLRSATKAEDAEKRLEYVHKLEDIFVAVMLLAEFIYTCTE